MREGGRYRKDATGERVLVERTGTVVPEAEAEAVKGPMPAKAGRKAVAPAPVDVAPADAAEGEE